jgi:hypothetical protein
MKKFLVALFLLLPLPAFAQTSFPTANGKVLESIVEMCINPSGIAAPCPDGITPPSSTTQLTGNAAGTTGAVVGTLAGAAGKTTYICGFDVSTIGGAASSGPITVAGLVGSSMVYQVPVNAAGGQTVIAKDFYPCLPASAVNTAITVTTTAAAGATAVDVNSWGYRQ